MTVSVIGLDGGPLPEEARDRLAKASLVTGGIAQLAHPDVPAGAETAVMGDASAGIDRIADHPGDVVVLAAGDPGYFGILRALRLRGIRPEVLPSRPLVALAFAAVAVPWDDAAVVSARATSLPAVVNACRALAKVAVLTGRGAGPAELGAGLDGWPRTLVVVERPGEPDTRVTRCQPAEAAARDWPEPSIVLVFDETRSSAGPQWTNQVAAPPAGFGWTEDRFVHHERTVTRREVRVLALSLLRPTLGTLVWDVGAGAGSVGVECAAMRAAVIAIDEDPEACALVRRNAAAFKVDVRVVQGCAPAAYAGLPDPDAVYVGGGGLPALEALVARRPPTIVAGYADVDRVGSARWLLTAAGYEVEGVQVAASRLAETPGGSVRLAAQNPVLLLSGRLR
ncbi:MAG TPA: precorrin-6Y C5,15-methyltransferase (decarboxylating) subunit CbiT [Mycobacteriales bacterium]|nr:precorrin-6Y C5,15-methyltransferase (decarboxylating) subunit CbiT [Mycobacteriales bacterium]